MQLINKSVRKTSLSIKKRLDIARHPLRPKGMDVLGSLLTNYEIIHGDRLYGDDVSIICALGSIENTKCLCIAQHKGSTLTEKQECNYGMTKPEGFRKIKRMMMLAEKFRLPIITIVDTPGALPWLEAEKGGQSRAIASNLAYLSDIKTRVISLVLSEGASGGALAVAVADRILMLEHAYFSVINPEGCASILWKDVSKLEDAAKALSMQSENLLEFSMIDTIIEEGDEGFHGNIANVQEDIKKTILAYLADLSKLSIDQIVDQRRKKYRSF